MDGLELFPGIDLGTRRKTGDGCAKPIGNRVAGRRRRVTAPRRSSVAHQLAELRRHIDARLDQVMTELHTLRQQRRDAVEVPEGILKRLTGIERSLRIIEPPVMPKLSRRHPVS